MGAKEMKADAPNEAMLEVTYAQKQIQAMRASTSKGKGEGFPCFRKAWRYFLWHYVSGYSKLETGAQGDAQSKAWFDELVEFSKGDELLNYLHQARHLSDHRLGQSAPLRAPHPTPSSAETPKGPTHRSAQDKVSQTGALGAYHG